MICMSSAEFKALQDAVAERDALLVSRAPTTDINSAKTAAVDRAYHWTPIDRDTPRGVKLQLISRPAGVAVYGIYTGDPHWTHYAPLPTFNKDEAP